MTLLLADVSEFQTVDWATYGASCPAVIVRAHNGFRADHKWAQNLAGSRAHCKWRGFYQYLPASVDPVKAAQAFAATVGPMLPGEVAILDLEEGAGDQRGRRLAWLDTLHAANEWTYSGLYFARQHLRGVRVDWVAAYQATEPTDAHVLWQNTNAHNWPGIGTADGNRFNGTLQDLIALTQEADMPVTEDDARNLFTGYPLLKDTRAANPDVAPRVAPSALIEFAAAQALANQKQLAAIVAAVSALTTKVGALTAGGLTQAQLEAALRNVLGTLDGK